MSPPRLLFRTTLTSFPVSTLRNPTIVLRALRPVVMQTSACSPSLLHAALKGGNSRRQARLVPEPHLPARSQDLPRPAYHLPFFRSWSGSAAQADVLRPFPAPAEAVQRAPDSALAHRVARFLRFGPEQRFSNLPAKCSMIRFPISLDNCERSPV